LSQIKAVNTKYLLVTLLSVLQSQCLPNQCCSTANRRHWRRLLDCDLAESWGHVCPFSV